MDDVFQRLKTQHEAVLREQQTQSIGVRPRMLRRLSTTTALAQDSKTDTKTGQDGRSVVGHDDSNSVGHVGRTDIDQYMNGSATEEFSRRREDLTKQHHSSPTQQPHPSQFVLQSPTADEIDKQFSRVFSIPMANNHSPSSSFLQQPAVRRVSRDTNLIVSRQETIHQLSVQKEEDEESDESSDIMVSPLKVGHGQYHDGNIQHQRLPDTAGVIVPARKDILVTKRERPSVLQDKFIPPILAQQKNKENFTAAKSSTNLASQRSPLVTGQRPPLPPICTHNTPTSPTNQGSTVSSSSAVKSPSELLSMRVGIYVR